MIAVQLPNGDILFVTEHLTPQKALHYQKPAQGDNGSFSVDPSLFEQLKKEDSQAQGVDPEKAVEFLRRHVPRLAESWAVDAPAADADGDQLVKWFNDVFES